MREFYANISFEAQSFVVIRGGKISFSAETINMKLGLDNGQNEYSTILKNAYDRQMLQMKKDLTFADEERPHHLQKCGTISCAISCPQQPT